MRNFAKIVFRWVPSYSIVRTDRHDEPLYLVLRRVRIVAGSAFHLRFVCPSVRPSTCISAASTGRISVKYDIWDVCGSQ